MCIDRETLGNQIVQLWYKVCQADIPTTTIYNVIRKLSNNYLKNEFIINLCAHSAKEKKNPNKQVHDWNSVGQV